MRRFFILPIATAASLAAPWLAAQALPSTLPTSTPAPAAQPPAAPPTEPARIQLTGGLLTVTANNSSLNQVLADVARATGTTITGGVVDQHIYGIYGPADPGTVLADLLSGSGSNMLLIQTAANTRQLILTPRNGGPTPPSPVSFNPAQSGQAAAPRDLPPQQTPRFDNRRNLPPRPPGQQPSSGTDNSLFSSPIEGATAPSTTDALPQPPADSTSTDQSPNGVKTPQQIYEQLMKLQQQNDKTPPQ